MNFRELWSQMTPAQKRSSRAEIERTARLILMEQGVLDVGELVSRSREMATETIFQAKRDSVKVMVN